MKRILIHEDRRLLGTIKQDLHSFYPRLEEMRKAYNGLEMGTFTNEVMEGLKRKGINQIEVDFYENLASQLDKSGITSKTIRQNLINGNTPLLLKFKTALQDVKTYTIPQTTGVKPRPALTIDFISFNDSNEKFQVDEKAENEILEKLCRVYVEGENEKAVYDSLQDLVKAQNDVIKSLRNVGYTFRKQGYEVEEILKEFFNNSSGSSINPTSIKYAVSQKKKAEERQRLLESIKR